MRVTSFLACQWATLDVDGKPALGGVGMDRIDTNGPFPIGLAFYFFARCEGEINDLPGPHTGELVLMGEDKVLNRFPIQFVTTTERPNQHLIININFVVRRPGRYRFDPSIDGQPVAASWPLEVRQVAGGGAPGGRT